jgi:hypothetical protein
MTRQISFQLTILLTWNLVTSFVLAQEPPVLKNVSIKLETTFSIDTDIYKYNYTIANSQTSVGQIGTLEIDISKPINVANLSGEGLVNGPGYSEVISDYVLKQNITPMISVGISSPPHWHSGLSILGTVAWGNDDNSSRMLPGQSIGGYQLTSRGLPGIRVFKIEPRIDFDHLPIAPPVGPADLERYKMELSKYKDGISVKGQTIGPTVPPAPFVPITFLSYLLGLQHEAQTLGWLGGPKWVLELDKTLNQVKESLVASEIGAAREKLVSFIEKVEERFRDMNEHDFEQVKKGEERKEKGTGEKKFLTSEGYVLLKFNAEYLKEQLERLKERDERDHKRDDDREHEEKRNSSGEHR